MRTLSFRARLAYSNTLVTFTPRGKRDSDGVHTRGFIRRNGRTIPGYVYDSVTETVFYPDNKSINYNFAYWKEAA